MSLPAYLFLYDENGMQIVGDCMAPDRERALEIMNRGSENERSSVDMLHSGLNRE